ncbi:unnamed protein product [Amoebophrya sp. A120]|nr:unnamed protein product [Amoebophrya sp. A120]|eukprot:GSA120T00008507001.1
MATNWSQKQQGRPPQVDCLLQCLLLRTHDGSGSTKDATKVAGCNKSTTEAEHAHNATSHNPLGGARRVGERPTTPPSSTIHPPAQQPLTKRFLPPLVFEALFDTPPTGAFTAGQDYLATRTNQHTPLSRLKRAYITEVAGPAGAGKSQLLMQLAVEHCKSQFSRLEPQERGHDDDPSCAQLQKTAVSCVLVLSTNRAAWVARLRSIVGRESDHLLQHIRVQQVNSLEDVLGVLAKLVELQDVGEDEIQQSAENSTGSHEIIPAGNHIPTTTSGTAVASSTVVDETTGSVNQFPSSKSSATRLSTEQEEATSNLKKPEEKQASVETSKPTRQPRNSRLQNRTQIHLHLGLFLLDGLTMLISGADFANFKHRERSLQRLIRNLRCIKCPVFYTAHLAQDWKQNCLKLSLGRTWTEQACHQRVFLQRLHNVDMAGRQENAGELEPDASVVLATLSEEQGEGVLLGIGKRGVKLLNSLT